MKSRKKKNNILAEENIILHYKFSVNGNILNYIFFFPLFTNNKNKTQSRLKHTEAVCCDCAICACAFIGRKNKQQNTHMCCKSKSKKKQSINMKPCSLWHATHMIIQDITIFLIQTNKSELNFHFRFVPNLSIDKIFYRWIFQLNQLFSPKQR